MPFGSPGTKFRWAVALTIFLVSTIYALRTNEIPGTAFFGGDTWEYQSMAVNYAAGHGLKIGAILPYERYEFDPNVHPGYLEHLDIFIEIGSKGGEERFYRTPAYPFLLGTIYKLVGVQPGIAMLIQMLTVIAIGAALPLLGNALLGWRGFAAGIPAGILVALFLAPDVLSIMTETLIALACFLILVAWVWVDDRRDWLSGTALGLTLAFALLVKGSLIFIPPMLIGYMLIRTVRSRSYSTGVIVASIVSLMVPVVAYSAWASSRASEPIFLSTQGRNVLLDGHNEYSIDTGQWSPRWKNEPDSFYSKAIAADPTLGTIELLLKFYREHPDALARGIVGRIETLGGGDDPMARLAINWFLAICLLYTALKAAQDRGAVLRYGLLAIIALAIVLTRADTVVSFAGLAIVGLAGLSGSGFRRHVRQTWTEPRMIGLLVVGLNFLVLTFVTFAEIRFIWPLFFLLLLSELYLLIRLTEELGVLPVLYSSLRHSCYRSVAREINPIARYSSALLYAGTSDDRLLFDLIEAPDKRILPSLELGESGEPGENECRLVVLNGVFNSSHDIEKLLSGMKSQLARRDRLLVVLYNPYLRWMFTLLDRSGLRTAPAPTTFVTRRSLESLTALSGFQPVRLRPAANFPLRLFGVGTLIDALLKTIPLVRHGALVNIALLRPIIPEVTPPSLSVVVPARNEAGNIRGAVERMPLLPGVDTELIFVEGGSTDDTAEEIRRVIEEYEGPLTLRSFTQTGTGKGDAVRLGFSHATGDVLTILDADLTMPPEMLGRFYDAYREGLGDFVNGNRLLYPMEGEAMRFLNTLGNIFFSKLLAWTLESPLGDTLCGTKVISRLDYERVGRWRDDFGDFDPFGDFELLFSAATMALGIVEVPVRYRARTYGTTNIHRFRHGLMLAKMSAIGFVRIKMGLGRNSRRVN